MVGAVTLLVVTPLPVKSATVILEASQLAAAARLKVVASTAEVPFILRIPLMLIRSAALSVTVNEVALAAATLALVKVYEPP